MSLSRIAPNTAWVRGKKPIWSRFCARAATACGLWATSSTRVGWPGDDLEAAGQLDQRQAGAHRLGADRQALAQRLESREGAGRVEQLVGAAQRRVAQGAEALPPGRPVPLLPVAGVIEVEAGAPQVGTDASGCVEHAVRRQRVAHDRRAGRDA